MSITLKCTRIYISPCKCPSKKPRIFSKRLCSGQIKKVDISGALIRLSLTIQVNSQVKRYVIFFLFGKMMFLNLKKMLTSVEATRIEKSMMEWLKKEMPGFRKNAHFKSGLAKTRITAYRYFRLDLKFME